MKATAVAHPNLALIKYMGRKDDVLRLPAHGSISMAMSGCTTTTTIEFSSDYSEDLLLIDGQHEGKESARAFKHLDRIRELARLSLRARIESRNTFPRSTGLSSSSSGFAALTVAAVAAAGMTLSEQELSILARQGSGSACRSIPGGFVEWLDGETSETSYGKTIFPPEHWDLCDVVAVVTTKPKAVTSSDSHLAVRSSPLYASRIAHMPGRIALCKHYLAEKNLRDLGPLIEQESEDLHALYESVGIVQRSDEALKICEMTEEWRKDVPVYFSLNTGQNVHLICEAKDADRVREKLKAVAFVRETIVNRVGGGARVTGEHLF